MPRSFESLFVEQCAPTLAGIKPASLFRCGIQSSNDVRQTVDEWDQALAQYGLRMRILKECPHTGDCMIYVYRPEWIARLLSKEDYLLFLDILIFLFRGNWIRSFGMQHSKQNGMPGLKNCTDGWSAPPPYSARYFSAPTLRRCMPTRLSCR